MTTIDLNKTEMTREEVRAQLAKNPLEWNKGCSRFGEEYLVAPLRVGELSLEMRIYYESLGFFKRVLLVLMFSAHRDEAGEILMRKVNDLPTLEEVKAIAEDQRLDLICRLLGIGD